MCFFMLLKKYTDIFTISYPSAIIRGESGKLKGESLLT